METPRSRDGIWLDSVRDRLDGKWIYLSRRYRGARLQIARLLWFQQVLIRLIVGFATLRGFERTRPSRLREGALQRARASPREVISRMAAATESVMME